jgi:aryl-alcohol dehydrogenase-like predicted oxidoreductase
MADAVEAGKIKAVGVSNYSAGQLRIAHAALAERGVSLASNQVEYSLLHRAPEVNGVSGPQRPPLRLIVAIALVAIVLGGLAALRAAARQRVRQPRAID